MFSIKSIMTTDVYCVKPTTLVYEALDLFSKHRISGLPVVNDMNQVVGILSEKDVLRILFDKAIAIDAVVEDYMSREVICFTEEESAIDICKFFIRTNMRRVPIVRDGLLVGIVSRHDIIKLILEAKSKISDYRYV